MEALCSQWAGQIAEIGENEHIKKILILGSTHLTKLACDELSNHYVLVGYVSTDLHPLTVDMNLPRVKEDEDFPDYDIKLSIQYTKKVFLMTMLEIYCMSLYNSTYEVIKNLGYIPLGLKNKDFSI